MIRQTGTQISQDERHEEAAAGSQIEFKCHQTTSDGPVTGTPEAQHHQFGVWQGQ